MEEEKKPAWAKCGECGNRQIFAYVPMEIMKFVELMRRVSCAVCGNADSRKFYMCDDPALGEKE